MPSLTLFDSWQVSGLQFIKDCFMIAITDSLIHYILTCLPPSLRTIDLHGFSLTPFSLSSVSKFIQLEQLCLGDSFQEFTWIHLLPVSVNVLSFSGVKLTCSALDNITNQLPRLRTLKVGASKITTEAATSFPQTVQALELSDVEITEEALLTIFKRCTQLTKLWLDIPGRLLRKSLFLQHIPITLEDFSLFGIFDTEALNALMLSMQQLTKLQSFYTNTKRFGDEELLHLPTSLKTLDVKCMFLFLLKFPLTLLFRFWCNHCWDSIFATAAPKIKD